jgi:hypothetical protein
MRLISRLAKGLLYAARLCAGLAVYVFRGKTPAFGHFGMVALFCLTNGRSNDFLSRLIGFVKRPYRFDKANGVLGNLSSKSDLAPKLEQLRSRGYCVFAECVPQETCDRLLQFALSQPCKSRVMDGGNRSGSDDVTYPRNTPNAVRYEFETQQLLGNEDVQRLLADLSIAALAQGYLGARPTIDVLAMWWHTAYSKSPDSEAAQYFHFDMDRPKWLKFFIYLTDVKTENGPHTFVAGSHRTGGMPSNLLSKGYVRLQDSEVAEAFNRSDIIEFAAPRGTIIAEDTRGLHKGKHVEEGDRLVLQIQFSNSLFGAIGPNAKLAHEMTAELRDTSRRYPSLYAAYLDAET